MAARVQRHQCLLTCRSTPTCSVGARRFRGRVTSDVRPLVTNGVALSQDSSYYVYALKDSRTSPALTFYVGKGVGTRSHDHLLKPDATRKGARIKEIVASGGQVLVSRLVDAITESQAIKLEAELISALGTVDSGGLLTNSVLPSGLSAKVRASVTVPSGVKERLNSGCYCSKMQCSS